MARNISNSDNVIDIRDVIDRIEELELERDEFILNETQSDDSSSWGELSEEEAKAEEKWNETDEGIELKNLSSLMEKFRGYGGDEHWRGDWYPITLIRDSYWEEYCKDMVKDIGDLPDDIPSYLYNNIDWKGVAEDLQVDYTSGEFDGVTYWAR
jgi:hypothetical protein